MFHVSQSHSLVHIEHSIAQIVISLNLCIELNKSNTSQRSLQLLLIDLSIRSQILDSHCCSLDLIEYVISLLINLSILLRIFLRLNHNLFFHWSWLLRWSLLSNCFLRRCLFLLNNLFLSRCCFFWLHRLPNILQTHSFVQHLYLLRQFRSCLYTFFRCCWFYTFNCLFLSLNLLNLLLSLRNFLFS